MLKKKIKYKKTIILFVTIIGLFLFLKYRRVHVKWDEELLMLNGDKIKVAFNWSHRAYYGIIPHSAIGGGGDRIDFILNFKGKTFRYGSKYIPIIIQKWEGALYILMKEMSDWNRSVRSLKIGNEIKEISLSDFPKFIAIQNRNFDKEIILGNPTKEYKIDPNEKSFRISLTAQIWYLLETDKNLLDDWTEIDREFLINYKQKYIDSKK